MQSPLPDLTVGRERVHRLCRVCLRTSCFVSTTALAPSCATVQICVSIVVAPWGKVSRLTLAHHSVINNIRTLKI